MTACGGNSIKQSYMDQIEQMRLWSNNSDEVLIGQLGGWHSLDDLNDEVLSAQNATEVISSIWPQCGAPHWRLRAVFCQHT